MTISWYGQACFRLESKDVSVLLDPFSKDIGLRPPKTNDPIILITHEHYDHNAVSETAEDALIVRGPGEYESRGIFIRGIQSYHDASQGAERGLNTIYTVRMEGIQLCHMGDFGQEALTDEQVEAIGNCDILMIPVGGVYTVGYKEAVAAVRRIEPRIVTPMHYKVTGLKIKLEGPEKFIKELGIEQEKVDKLKIMKKTLPAEDMKAVVFKR